MSIAGLSLDAVNLDARNLQGETVLMMVAENEDFNLIKELIEAGADVSIIDNQGRKAADYTSNEYIKEYLEKAE